MYSVRHAIKKDIPFLIQSIINADKSSTDICSYCKLIEIEELELVIALKKIFDEEIDGCEFSLTAFIVVVYSGEPIAACASWIEAEEGMPSWQIRMAALRSFVPAEKLQNLTRKAEVCNTLLIKRSVGTLQIESVFIHPNHRGKELLAKMIDFHVNEKLVKTNDVFFLELLTYNSNLSAEKAYTKFGFVKVEETTSNHSQINQYYPSNGMTRWQKLV